MDVTIYHRERQYYPHPDFSMLPVEREDYMPILDTYQIPDMSEFEQLAHLCIELNGQETDEARQRIRNLIQSF